MINSELRGCSAHSHHGCRARSEIPPGPPWLAAAQSPMASPLTVTTASLQTVLEPEDCCAWTLRVSSPGLRGREVCRNLAGCWSFWWQSRTQDPINSRKAAAEGRSRPASLLQHGAGRYPDLESPGEMADGTESHGSRFLKGGWEPGRWKASPSPQFSPCRVARRVLVGMHSSSASDSKWAVLWLAHPWSTLGSCS